MKLAECIFDEKIRNVAYVVRLRQKEFHAGNRSAHRRELPFGWRERQASREFDAA
jgi:hypothetical protein